MDEFICELCDKHVNKKELSISPIRLMVTYAIGKICDDCLLSYYDELLMALNPISKKVIAKIKEENENVEKK